MKNSITFGKSTITSFPEYFEIKDRKKINKNTAISLSIILVLLYLYTFYENIFDPNNRSYTAIILLGFWGVILFFQIRMNVDSKIEKSKIKQVSIKKGIGNPIIIYYDEKQRQIDTFSEEDAQQVIKFLMNNK